MRRLTLVKLAGLAVLVAGIVVASLLVDVERLADRGRLRQQIEEDYLVGVGLFLVVAIGIKLLFVPASPLSVAAGYLFGGIVGSALAVVSLTVSSMIGFAIARYLGRDFVHAMLEGNESDLERFDEAIERHGFLTTLFFRVVPILPLAVVNLGLGVTRVRARDFTLATVVGVLPGVVLLANVGHRLDDPSDPWLYAFAAGFVVLVGSAALLARRAQR